MNFVIQTRGDPSVGISGDYAELTVDLSYLDVGERRETIQHIKKELTNLFAELWDEKPYVHCPCPKCHGDGYETIATNSVVTTPCPHCDGTGQDDGRA